MCCPRLCLHILPDGSAAVVAVGLGGRAALVLVEETVPEGTTVSTTNASRNEAKL